MGAGRDYPFERFAMPQDDTGRIYDELLVTLVQMGDRRAAERLAVRWQPRLLRTARRLLRDPDQALDAVQESWIGILRGAAMLHDAAHFPAWAFGTLHRKCADRIRGEQRIRALPEQPVPTGESGEDRAAITQALDAMSDDQRASAIFFFGEA